MQQALPPPAKAEANLAAPGQYLIFVLGAESYGVPVLTVRAIERLPEITPVPQMPDYITGVINLRGRVIPVMDLRIRFRLSRAELHERTLIMVVDVRFDGGSSSLVGLIVDAVEGVSLLAEADIGEPPNFGGKLNTDYITGMAKVKGQVKVLLDVDRLVTAETLSLVQENTQPTANLQGAA